MNKKERVLAVINGQEPDVVPAGFWFHYGPALSPEEMVEEHWKLFTQTDMDVIKIMQDYMYPVEGTITCAQDWRHIRVKGTDSEEFGKLASIIRGLRGRAGEDVLIFMTMFGPYKAASIAFGDDVLMKYSREDPAAVKDGIQIIADALEEWAEGYLDAGADGIYYSAQFGEVGRYEQNEWEQLVRPYDLQILGVAQRRTDKYNLLHICGEPEYDFRTYVDRYAGYPGELVNWSVKDNGYSLRKGRETFGRAVLGGLNNKGNIVSGPEDAVRAEVKDVLDAFGTTKGIMIGADCTVQGRNIRLDYIKAAVEAAHQYKLQY